MSLKDLFKEQQNLKSAEVITKDDFKDEIESFDYAAAINKRNARYVATENFDNPSNFARFGLAEKYYEDAVTRIHDSYPYDGSLKEKVLWEVSSSLIDLYIFENGYPRSTGYANFTKPASSTGAQGAYYYPPTTQEYILVKGGPHAGTGNTLYYDQTSNKVVYRKDANVFNLDENRESNLLIDGTKGNTVEFWLKKDAYVSNQDYFEYILDVNTTGSEIGQETFGRFSLALATTGTAGNGSNQAFSFLIGSGSRVINNYIGSSNLTTGTIADGKWHHYALRYKTSGSSTVVDLFVDGKHDDTVISGSATIGYVSGAIVATVGALSDAVKPSPSSPATGSRGWAPFSGSLDEFRYWKRCRTSKQIQTRWFDQVGGGTNTDLSNTDLGVYFKFNEGITQTSSVDSVVLDYAGRVSNGSWVGYDATYSRNTGSAILESSASLIEFKDPIIYSFHPEVLSYRTDMMTSGSLHDDGNVNCLKSYVPAWILDENETGNDNLQSNYLLNLLQVIASYFDEATVLLQKLPQLSHAKYYQGQSEPPPFNKKALESSGFMVPDLFVDASLLESFEGRDNELKFEKNLQEIKNIIYQNIYNNLNYIYKSKGTEKSIRNLLRCFGIGDNVLKINLYANESVYKLEDNLKLTTRRKNHINFNQLNSDGSSNDKASIYQYKIDDNSTSYISGTNIINGTLEGAGLSFTLESNVILPNRVSQAEYATIIKSYENKVANLYPLRQVSSLFGLHGANYSENNLTWATNDYANFQVITVKDDLYSSNAYFKLTGTAGTLIPELSSSVFSNAYDDELWTISVTIEPSKIESINQVGSTALSDYTVRFYGVSHIADYKANEFLVTGTISNDSGRKILASPKRVFVGAHRTNFTGSVLQHSDVKVNSCKAWFASIPTGTIDNHNLKIENYGSQKPTKNAFLYQNSINDKFVPESKTLALLWNFSSVTASNAGGEFSVEDETSGSANDNRYGWFSDLVSRRHTASGSFFINSSKTVVESLERSTYQTQVPEVLTDENLTRILSQDDEFFNRNTRPTTYHLSIEKNLFQDVSEEMINMFGSVVWFNNLIGTPVNSYRGDYKELKKAADIFFEKVGNDYDFDKYVEYFKFIDYSVSRYLVNLIPASMLSFEDGISTIIENFALGDRNKFRNKLTYLKEVDSEPITIGNMSNAMMVAPSTVPGFSDNIQYTNLDAPATNVNSYKHMQAPINNSQKTNAAYWNQRSERANPIVSSGDTAVDANRQILLDVINNNTNTSAPTLRDSSNSQNYKAEGNVFVSRRYGRVYSVRGINKQDAHGGSVSYENKKIGFWDSIRKRPTQSTPGEGGLISIEPPDSKLESFKDSNDNLELNKGKRKYKFSAATVNDGGEDFSNVFKGDFIFPFSIYSSSVTNNPAMSDLSDFQSNLAITNLHQDSYGPQNEIPMQGPFTEKYVGGRAYRHVMTNFTPDNQVPESEGERLEGWRVTASAGRLDLVNVSPHNPKSVYFREEYAKRPVNIKNIKQLTGAAETQDQFTDAAHVTKIGNYSENYEIVMTNGRSINNRMRVAEFSEFGLSLTRNDLADSTAVSGVVDFAIPRRDLTGSSKSIIVNRFSAPGDPATMGEGMLDTAAAEYSVYNALPFRNLSVRQPLQELLSNHANQFGLFSDQFTVAAYEELDGAGFIYPGGSSSINDPGASLNYIGTGSFHKVNRNGRKQPRYANIFTGDLGTISTSASFDNFFLQHAIPQTDAQYAWITASLVENYTGSALYDYENKGFDRGDFASSDLVFASASNSGSNNIKVDFIGLNTLVVDGLNPRLNLLSGSEYYNDKIQSLSDNLSVNSLLSHRGGPAGGSNWKLYKKDYHPIVRHQKEHNQIGYSQGKGLLVDKSLKFIKDVEIKNFTEPPITSKYKPLRFSFKEPSQEKITNVVLSLGNIRCKFTDHTAESILSDEYSIKHLDSLLPVGTDKEKIKNLTYNSYAGFKNFLDSKNLKNMTEVAYAETIYPKALYTYLSGTRKRINFTNDFWREKRINRTKSSLKNSNNNSILSSSIWKLDAHAAFPRYAEDAFSGAYIPYSGGMTQKDGAGELQNCYSLFHYNTASNIVPGLSYARRIKLLHQLGTELNPFATPVPLALYTSRVNLTSSNRNLTRFRFKNLTSASMPALFSASAGDTLWEASSSNNYKPFYDSYDEYAEEGFRNLKDGTVLPEFRISEKVDDYINADVNLNYNNYSPKGFFTAFLNQNGNNNLEIETGLLSLTGGLTYNTTEEFLNRYAFSDFYDYFKLVEEDYESKVVANDPTSQLMATAPKKVARTAHKLSCEAILKFLPYDGFYPAERATQLGTLFSESIASNTRLEGTEANLRTLLQPFFAPGILFNSIKSGIAVDYPIFNQTASFTKVDSVAWGTAISGNFDKRLKIDELIEPQFNTILDAEMDPDFIINSTASYKFTTSPKHTFAMSNFLAETMNLFIGRQSSEQSMIVQAGETALDHHIVIPRSGTYSFDLHLVNSKNIVDYKSFASASFYQFNSFISSSAVASASLSSSLQVNTPSITMYNRAITGYNIDPFLYGSSFGPPVEVGMPTKEIGGGVLYASPATYSASFVTGTAFDPYTAPYYNGFSTVRVSVGLNPADYDGGVITREEIFASASYTYDRMRTFYYGTLGPKFRLGSYGLLTELTGNVNMTTNYRHSMQLSASMFLGDENPDQVIYEREAKINPDIETSNVETRQIVAFKPRWECPILDFTNVTPTESYISGNVAKGMWHQYGEIPQPGDGVFMKVEPGTAAIRDDYVGKAVSSGLSSNLNISVNNLDLLSLLNINPKQTSKVGKINAGGPGASNSIHQVAATFSKFTKKQFSEAIIAIPFKFNKTRNETILYPINKDQTDLIKDNLYRDPSSRFEAQSLNNIRRFDEIRKNLSPTNIDANPLLESSRDLYDLMLLMRKYVIPPHLDFLHNDGIDPYVMFMIEYSIDLKKRDLQNIWQNVEPTFSRRALRVTSESNLHLMPTSEQMLNNQDVYFKETLFDPDVTRWAVFKVKKRAAANYNSVVGKIVHNNHEYIRKDLKGKTDDFLYSYNWPNDFFSLIELAKINSITTFNPNYKVEEEE